jgi:anti-sigma regulatory factor (Ser/Thr protein kinase)
MLAAPPGSAPDDGETLVTELFANVIKHATGKARPR